MSQSQCHGTSDDIQLYRSWLVVDGSISAAQLLRCIEGISRWMASNWPVLNVDKTQCIWLDSPGQLDVQSQPSSTDCQWWSHDCIWHHLGPWCDCWCSTVDEGPCRQCRLLLPTWTAALYSLLWYHAHSCAVQATSVSAALFCTRSLMTASRGR